MWETHVCKILVAEGFRKVKTAEKTFLRQGCQAGVEKSIRIKFKKLLDQELKSPGTIAHHWTLFTVCIIIISHVFGLLAIVYFYPKLDYNLKGRGQVLCSVLSGVCQSQRYSNSLDNKGMTE